MSTIEIICVAYMAIDLIATIAVLIALKRKGISIKRLAQLSKEREDDSEKVDLDSYADELADTID